MKQIVQSYKTGQMDLEETSLPQVVRGAVLVETMASLVSAGTEKMLVGLAKKSLLGKARSRPDLVKKVIEKAKREGLFNTIQKVRSKLDTPIPLGYSCAGIVREVGEGVDEFHVGDWVACGGAGYANHADFNVVPRNLCVRLPEGGTQHISWEEAAFATVGSIALQGVRQAGLTLGERVCVLGLGLLGQLTVQLCRANGCPVIGSDIDQSRIETALSLGTDCAVRPDEIRAAVDGFTRGVGADAVIITAASSDDRLIETAGEISRVKGRVVVVGFVGMNVPRDVYYKKELDLRVSMSYGPGRYDPEYEERGHDYPLPYVRWTEKRNMQTFLELVASGRVVVKPLVTHRFSFEKALDAYGMILNGTEPHLAVLFEYKKEKYLQVRSPLCREQAPVKEMVLGVIGAGNFARGVLLPNFKENPKVTLKSVTTARGMTANAVAKQFGIRICASSSEEILADKEVNTVLIATRHNLHGPLVAQALKSGKHVFVEKPLCTTMEQLREIAGLFGCTLLPRLDATENISQNQVDDSEMGSVSSAPLLMVGFNRRFAPCLRKAADLLKSKTGPFFASYTINAGMIPKESWIQDPVEGGGRIIGEVCHFLDALRFLSGSPVKTVQAACIHTDDNRQTNRDSVSVVIKYVGGSVGTILYHAMGSPDYPKERIQISVGGTTIVVDDFRSMEVFGQKRERLRKSQDKGFKGELNAFVNCVIGKFPAPISLREIFETTIVTFAIHHSLNTGTIVSLPDFALINGINI